jgi:hypothetical protein
MRDDVLYVMKEYENTDMFYINNHYFLNQT